MLSPVAPAVSQSWMLKSSSPGSAPGSASISPFSSLSSSNTYTVTVDVGTGFGSILTVNAVGSVHELAALVVHDGVMAVPPIVCPQLVTEIPVGVVPLPGTKQRAVGA